MYVWALWDEKTPRENTKSVISGGRSFGRSGGVGVRRRGPGQGIRRGGFEAGCLGRGVSCGGASAQEGVRGRYEQMKNKDCAEIKKINKVKKSSKKKQKNEKNTQKYFAFFCFFFGSFLRIPLSFQRLFLYCCNFLDVFGILSTFSVSRTKTLVSRKKASVTQQKFFVSPKKCSVPKKSFCVHTKKSVLHQKKVFCIQKKKEHHLRGTLYPKKKLSVTTQKVAPSPCCSPCLMRTLQHWACLSH